MKENLKIILYDLIFDNVIVRFVRLVDYIAKGFAEHKEYFKGIEFRKKRKIPLAKKMLIVLTWDLER